MMSICPAQQRERNATKRNLDVVGPLEGVRLRSAYVIQPCQDFDAEDDFDINDILRLNPPPLDHSTIKCAA
jgi:hypothetical protein